MIEEPPIEIEWLEHPAGMPGVYIDQRIFPAALQNRRDLYSDLLNICKEDGLPTKQLTQDALERLGTARLQRWIDEEKTAYRLESWDYHMAEPQQPPKCRFYLVSRGEHVLISHEGMRGMYLDDNTAYEQTPLSNADAGLLLRSPARETVKPNDVIQQVAGQPCVETGIADTESAVVCTWSGGVKWGFEPRAVGLKSVLETPRYDLFRRIILQQDPAEHPLDKVTTVSFIIGDALDDALMRPTPATALPANMPLP